MGPAGQNPCLARELPLQPDRRPATIRAVKYPPFRLPPRAQMLYQHWDATPYEPGQWQPSVLVRNGFSSIEEPYPDEAAARLHCEPPAPFLADCYLPPKPGPWSGSAAGCRHDRLRSRKL